MSSLLAGYTSTARAGNFSVDEVNAALEAIFSMGEVPLVMYVPEKTVKRLRWAMRRGERQRAHRRYVESRQARKRGVRRIGGRLK